jgi:hypothetical protein
MTLEFSLSGIIIIGPKYQFHRYKKKTNIQREIISFNLFFNKIEILLAQISTSVPPNCSNPLKYKWK